MITQLKTPRKETIIIHMHYKLKDVTDFSKNVRLNVFFTSSQEAPMLNGC